MKRTAVIAVLLGLSISISAQGPKPHGEHEHHAVQVSADQVWNELAAGNRRFAEGKSRPADYVARREQLVKGQHPRVAVLSCSDSRVPPELLFDQSLGDLFVVRTAGNSADAIGIGSLEYAVEHLGSTVLVVLGHQSCGAVSAACSGSKMPTPSLEAVVLPVQQSCAAAKQRKGGDVIDFAVHDHVHQVAQALLAKSAVLKHAVAEGKLTIVEAYYRLDSGLVTRLH